MTFGQIARCLVAVLTLSCAIPAQQSAPASQEKPSASSSAGKDAFLLTVFLNHDQSKTLDQIEAQLGKTGFYREFPPAGTEVVSWYVVMGIGQVVTLRVPAERLRDVNRFFEQRAWGAFRTQFYATYDFKPAWHEMKAQQPR